MGPPLLADALFRAAHLAKLEFLEPPLALVSIVPSLEVGSLSFGVHFPNRLTCDAGLSWSYTYPIYAPEWVYPFPLWAARSPPLTASVPLPWHVFAFDTLLFPVAVVFRLPRLFAAMLFDWLGPFPSLFSSPCGSSLDLLVLLSDLDSDRKSVV